MCHSDPGFGDQAAEPGGNPINGLNPVVYEKDLAVTNKFPSNRRSNLAVVVGPDIGQDRVALFRWSLDGGHLTDTRE